MTTLKTLIDKLHTTHSLSLPEYETLLRERNEDAAALLAELATTVRRKHYGNDIYIRGLIEVSNICKNDCLYCGIRRSNKDCDRYRLMPEDILACCAMGYDLGFRTFVLQGGEDPHFTDELLVNLIREIKTRYPDCALTLSLGERSRESYQALFNAGGNRYLLRHETADASHYGLLHPADMSFENRMECLRTLKEIGFQTGCGIMVGSPGQTVATLAKDLKFIETFAPQMCGIGPFIPHRDTPFCGEPAGSLALTTYLLSIIRLIHPQILLPATTALATLDPIGREKGILAGANVVMPNLSPEDARGKYTLYDNKAHTGVESAEGLDKLRAQMQAIGYRVVTARGDHPAAS